MRKILRDVYTHLKVIKDIKTITKKLMNYHLLLPDSAVSHSDTIVEVIETSLYISGDLSDSKSKSEDPYQH